jgi:hypothetical protein
MISESLGAVWAVESMRHPWEEFRWWFLSPKGLFWLSNQCVIRDNSSLMISESLGHFGLSNPCVTPDSSSLMISESLGALWAVESLRHPWHQFHWWFWVTRVALRCWIQASPVAAVWVMISQFLGLFALSKPCITRGRSFVDDFWVLWAVCAVESMRHPWQHFRWWC